MSVGESYTWEVDSEEIEVFPDSTASPDGPEGATGELRTGDTAETLISEATRADIECLKNVYNLEESDASKKNLGRLKKNYEEDLNQMRKILNSDFQTEVKRQERSQAYSLKALETLGALEKVGSGRYKVKISEGAIDLIENEFDVFWKYEHTEEGLIKFLKEEHEKGNDITTGWLKESDSRPSRNAFRRIFGGLNNARWRAGIEPVREKTDQDIIVDQLLEKYHAEQRIPDASEFYSDPDTPDYNMAGNHFGSYETDPYEHLLKEAGLLTRRKIQNSDDQGDKFYVEK